jgi:hypothetical protein
MRREETGDTLCDLILCPKLTGIRDIITVLFHSNMKLSRTVNASLAGILGIFCLATAIATEPAAAPSAASADPNLSATQIVAEMQGRNQARAAALKHFHSVRHYSVEYRGYNAKIAAQMAVDADYDAASGKTFRIVSQSGSKLLIDKVLKRLLESETDAQKQRSAELTSTNYSFQLAGVENVAGRPAYVLEVEPLTDNKYLYRGKIWVDAADFAVARIEAAPAKNLSFWISSTLIHHKYTKTGEFWLPAKNESDTEVRVGGRAVLTIDYGVYEVAPSPPMVVSGN